jgi:hypothetical protein
VYARLKAEKHLILIILTQRGEMQNILYHSKQKQICEPIDVLCIGYLLQIQG